MDNRKRVCLISEGMVDFRLADGLAERAELTLVSRGIERPTTQPPQQSFQQVKGPTSRLKFGLFVWTYITSRRADFDAFVVMGYGLAALCANLALFRQRSSLTLLIGSPSERYYTCRKINPTYRKRYSAIGYLAWLFLARANRILAARYVTVSQYLADVVRSHGTTRADIHIIPVYGVNTQVFTPRQVPLEGLRSQLKLPSTGKILLYSSRVAPEKDFRTVLRALKRLLDTGVDAWVVNPSGGYREFLEEASVLGVSERVIARDAYHPYFGLAQLYQSADLCIQASIDEGLGLSPLEALACGTPVVASAVGGLQETIREGFSGWTVPAGDDEKLAAVIVEILSSGAEVERRVSNGRELVLRKFEASKSFADFIDCI